MRQESENSHRNQESKSKGNASCNKELRLAERNRERCKNHDDNRRGKLKAVRLHRFDDIRKNELGRECAQLFAIKIPMSITVLEVMQRMRIPAREVSVNKSDLAVRTVLFTENIQSPSGNIFRSKGFFHLSKLSQSGNICRIFTGRAVKYTGVRQLTDFFDDFQTRFLGILGRNKGLERQETAKHRIFFHKQTVHERIVKFI